MDYLLWAIVIIAIAFAGQSATKANKQTKKAKEETGTDNFDYTKGYKSKWLFTPHEKEGYAKIKEVTDKLGLTLFAKVRLYDLVEPKTGVEHFKGHQYKIQAKHCDFVVCSEKLVAKAVIELDDASHDTAARKERDTFVDTVLQNCGYKVIHMRNIDPAELETQLSEFSAVKA